MEVKLAADGTLEILQRGSNRDGKLIAYREDVARAKGLPAAVELPHPHDRARSERDASRSSSPT